MRSWRLRKILSLNLTHIYLPLPPQKLLILTVCFPKFWILPFHESFTWACNVIYFQFFKTQIIFLGYFLTVLPSAQREETVQNVFLSVFRMESTLYINIYKSHYTHNDLETASHYSILTKVFSPLGSLCFTMLFWVLTQFCTCLRLGFVLECTVYLFGKESLSWSFKHW